MKAKFHSHHPWRRWWWLWHMVLEERDMGVVPTKGQVALWDHLPPESPPTSPLHVRTVGACVALSNIRCFSCLFQCFVILFIKCRALNYLSWFCILQLGVFVFSSVILCFSIFLVFSIPWFYILLHGCPLFICSKQSHQFLHSVLTSTQSASQNVARSWRK